MVVCLAHHSLRSASYDVSHRSDTPSRLAFLTVAALSSLLNMDPESPGMVEFDDNVNIASGLPNRSALL